MKNKNIVDKIVAKKLNKPLDQVATVNSFYWKTIKNLLIPCDQPTIFIKHLGSITTSKYKIHKEIKGLINKIRFFTDNPNYTEHYKTKTIQEARERLKQLLVHRNIIAQDEYDRRVLGINKKGMEESEDDSDIDDNED